MENETPATAAEPTQRKLRHAIAEEVRVILVRRRMSATELARQLGWSQTYMARRMVGAYPFSVDDLEDIAAYLAIPITDLMPSSTGRYPTDLEPVTSGTFAHPDHPVLASAVRLPRSIVRQRTTASATGQPPKVERRTAPTGL